MKRALLASLAVLVAAAAPAAAQAPVALEAATPDTGYVALTVTGPPGATARLSEVAEPAPVDLGSVVLDAAGRATVHRAATWSCTARRRVFHADLGAAGVADASVRTPGCGRRFALAVEPRRPRAGQPLTVTVRDRWRVGGVRLRLCATGPAGRSTCSGVRLRAGARTGEARLALPATGRWRLALPVPGVRAVTEDVDVRPAGGRLRVLATGDSMVQIVDGFLRERLAPARVRSDARISTGISKPGLLDWVAHARAQVRRYRADVTVVFLGANDGFDLGDVGCCSRAWSAAYAARAERMMRSYARRGAATTYWVLLPAPRRAAFRRVFKAVNRGIRIAAREHPGTVRLVDLPATFTPGYRFRQAIRWHGRTVSVRQDDGVHLNVAGASIAAALIARELRRDGLR